MSQYYATDDEVQRVTNLRQQVSAAHWVFRKSEADADYHEIIHDMEWIIRHLQLMLKINASIRFAVVSSPAPFQVARTGKCEFLILVDQNAFYDLINLNYRIQTLPSLSESLNTTPIALKKEHQGRYLLDIVKDFLRNPIDILEAIEATKSLVGHQASMLFIIGHEISHITHGHLDFKNSPFYKEFLQTKEDENLTLRTLEMDADSSGATNVFATMEYVISLILEQRGITDRDEWDAKSGVLRQQYITGTYIALLYSEARMKSFFTSKYPISYARFLTVSSVLKIALKRHIGDVAASAPEQARINLANAFAAISGSLGALGHPIATNMIIWEPGASTPSHQYNELGELIGLEQLEPLYSRWSRLRPFLELYQLGGKLAPAIAEPA